MIPYGAPRQMQQPGGTKRQRDDLELEMGHLPEGSMQGGGMQQAGGMQGMPSQMSEQAMVGYGGQPVQTYHSHPLPNTGHRSKMPRIGDPRLQHDVWWWRCTKCSWSGGDASASAATSGAKVEVHARGRSTAGGPKGKQIPYLETDCGVFPRTVIWDFTGPLLHKVEGKDNAVDGRDSELSISQISRWMANSFHRFKSFARHFMTTSRRNGA